MEKENRMNKREEYIMNQVLKGTPESDREQIVEFIRKHFTDSQSKRYTVWIANQLKHLLPSGRDKFSSEDFQEIIDWASSENKDIFKFSFEEAVQEQKKWHEKLESNPEYVKKPSLDKSRIIHQFPNGFFVYILTPKDLRYEGSIMGHCVGTGQRYANSIRNGESIILSLRGTNNNPHATVEIKVDGGITQIQGKGNKTPIPEYTEMIIEFMEFVFNL